MDISTLSPEELLAVCRRARSIYEGRMLAAAFAETPRYACSWDAAMDLALREAAVVACKAPPLASAEVAEHKTIEVADTNLTTPRNGVVEGYLAVFNNTDLVKDIILPGAFAATLVNAKAAAKAHNTASMLPLLWQHDKGEPIGGIFEAYEDSHGLFIKARLNLNIERGRQAFDGLKHGYMSFSIGYSPTKYSWKGSTRILSEIGLIEGSAVTFPANPKARATSAHI